MERYYKKLIILFFLLFSVIILSQTALDKAEVYYFNGKSAFQVGEYNNAEKFFEEALKLTAQIEIKYPDIRYMLGWAKFYLKKYKEAENYLKYYTDDPKVQLALKSIKEGNVQEELSFRSLKIQSTESTVTNESTSNVKIGLFYYIITTAVIFIIIGISGFLIYFFVLRKYSFNVQTENKVESVENEEEAETTEEEIIPLEEVLEVKIDELEELWYEYEKMKNKLDVDEEEISVEENLEEIDVDSLLSEDFEEDTNLDIEDLEDAVNENETVENKNEPIEDNTSEELQVEKDMKLDEEENTIEDIIENEKIKDLSEIETVKPNVDVLSKYNKIINEPEGKVVVSNIKGLESLDEIDKEVNKKGGQYTKGDLHNIFKEIFADKNRDQVSIE
ncbi:tetratricopeptide repeat protein [Marinitoga litoralis]|uniref:tetratricopeptide repeat protein n=1 Tax=Marinitoga litoralis TaxID=570855 RepID=UPI0019609439|nr:tetratricopeptide repeat protein [Marinitoga litoralis]MBM7559433.1 tetratricopeptide (TPR) repeat protein [Marinitoga litoralis]